MSILNTLPHNARLPQHVVSAVSHRLLWVASITKNTSSAATHTIIVHFVQSTPTCLWQSAKSCIFAASKYIMTSKVSKNRGIEQLPWNSNVEVLIFQLRCCLMPFYMLRVCITLTPKFYAYRSKKAIPTSVCVLRCTVWISICHTSLRFNKKVVKACQIRTTR